MKLDFCWSAAHLSFSVHPFPSFLCIFISARTILRPGNFYHAIFSPALALSFFLSLFLSVCLWKVDENNRGNTATKYYRTIVCFYLFLQLAYLAGNNTKVGWGEKKSKDLIRICVFMYVCRTIHACICMHVGIYLRIFACPHIFGSVCLCVYVHSLDGIRVSVCVCVFAFLFVVTQNVLTF